MKTDFLISTNLVATRRGEELRLNIAKDKAGWRVDDVIICDIIGFR